MAKYKDSKDPNAYADGLRETKITGGYSLAYRDVPQLIKDHVKGTKVLDYGCGTGNSAIMMKQLGLQVDAVDIEPKMVETCKERDPEGQYKVIKSGEIPAEDNQYDLVLASLVLPYVSTKAEMVKIFKEIGRILKADGCFIAVAVSSELYGKEWKDAETRFKENENPYSGMPVKMLVNQSNLLLYQYYWTENDYREAFKESGLNIVKVHSPLGKEDDGYDWSIEKEMAPFIIFVAEK